MSSLVMRKSRSVGWWLNYMVLGTRDLPFTRSKLWDILVARS